MNVPKLPDFNDPFIQQAARDMAFDFLDEAGVVPPAERKAHEAHRAEFIDEMDARQGTTAVTYSEFRDAFEMGAGCAELVDLKNRMHPKDPLRDAAISDLRSVGCSSRTAERRAPDAQS